MRKTAIGLAILLICLALTPPAAVSDSGEILADGIVRDGSGKAIPGATVEIWMWPAEDVAVGEAVPQTLVGSDTADDAGRFEVTAQRLAAMVRESSKDGGYVDLELRVVSKDLVYENFFALPVSPSGDVGQAVVSHRSDRPIGAKIQLSRRVFGVARVSQELGSARGADPTIPCLNWYKIEDLSQEWATVGEVHQWGSRIKKGTLKYGKTADTTFGVGLKSGGSWGVSGSSHVGNSETTAGSSSVSEGATYSGYRIRGKFLRAEYAQACTSNLKRKATQWNGLDITHESPLAGYDGHCDDWYSGYAHQFAQWQDSWSRSSNESRTWGAALDLGPVTVDGTSGYSTDVETTFTFETGVVKKLCGDDGPIGSAHRVFAGTG